MMLDESANNALLLENPLQLTKSQADLSIVGSCNGLVCLFVKYGYYDYDMFIYNPSTRIWNGLPFRGRNREHYVHYTVAGILLGMMNLLMITKLLKCALLMMNLLWK